VVIVLACVAGALLFAAREAARTLGAPRKAPRPFVALEEREAELAPLLPLVAARRRIGYLAWDPDKGRLFKTQYTVAPTLLTTDTRGVDRLLVELELDDHLTLERATWRLLATSPRARFFLYERRAR
jgi:hypothetical protein